MTSGVFEQVPISSIIINREVRQRRELEKVPELAESIRVNGLINPITITRSMELIAGERRLEAHKLLGYEVITAQYAEDMDSTQLHLIELEENIRRVDLAWVDHVKAVSDFHAIQTRVNEKWSAAATAEALNMSQTHVARHLNVREALDEGVEGVVNAPKFSVAANFAERRSERQKASAMRDLTAELTPYADDGRVSTLQGVVSYPTDQDAPTRRFLDMKQGDFLAWSAEVQAVPFNFLHVDFPYGVQAGKLTGQSSSKSHGGYEDSKDIYFTLLDTFVNNIDNFCDPSAHLVFWFSLHYYAETVEALTSAGFVVNKFPLIWHKTDNSGILQDSNRGPRRTYETALFASRGDRKIVRAVASSFGCGNESNTDKYHMSQKPEVLLEHFFRMVVDENTRMLDPTAGSGAALKVAERLGAAWSLGLELNPEYVERARLHLGL
tara:strand:- start:853 stop:2169 length:1317 start_codon:yes stop_codon:yes gene_type:complete